jgi:uncharacterized protein (TIGR03085 family)
MTRMSKTERWALCDLALQVGEDEPTLCEGWTVKDLVVHLVLRESSPAAAGIVVPGLSRVTDLASRRLGRRDFTVLVEKLRTGPPVYSPLAVPRLDAMVNTIEYFVHHEDIRRAQPSWEPRELTDRQQRLLWKQISVAGKGMVRDAGVGVAIERSDTGDRAVLRAGTPSATVRGLPGELVLFLLGRRPQARVELTGPDDAVAALGDA